MSKPTYSELWLAFEWTMQLIDTELLGSDLPLELTQRDIERWETYCDWVQPRGRHD